MFVFFLLYYCAAFNWNITYISSPVTYFRTSNTCSYVKVSAGEYCSLIGESKGISVSDIERYNKNNYNWKGCNNVQVGYLLCVSESNFPRPESNPKAECGPYAPAFLFNSECPLNACCSQYGFCGLTSEFCGEGCYSNCGSGSLRGPSGTFGSIGYWMDNGYSLSNLDYDIVQYAFVVINPDFSIDDSKYAKSGFNDITNKRVVSFGGWEFSTNPSTYNISRSGVTLANRNKLASNIADFASKYNLDGIDLDWEYPGAPDIPGIPADIRASAWFELAGAPSLFGCLGDRYTDD